MKEDGRGKKGIPVYVYHHKEFVAKADTIKEAAQMADTNSTTARMILLGKCDCTRDGWVFTNEPLTDEELKECPDRHEEKHHLKRINGSTCRKEVEQQSYSVDCKEGMVTYIPRSKEARKAQLRQMIWSKLSDRWMIIPKAVATLEKQAFREIIESL